MNAVVPFMTPAGDQVRVVMVDNEPWFVLADLTRVLDLRQFRVDRLEDGLIRNQPIADRLGRMQPTAVVSEPGMYEVVIRSDKPQAAAFRRWITAEVLPEIRKTGSYGTVAALEGPELLAHAVLAAQRMITARDERIAELEPKADLADTFLTAQGGSRLIREAAKLLGLKERDLRTYLIDDGLIFAKHSPCGAIMYDRYAQFAHHFQSTEHLVHHTWGTCTHYTLRVLPRGIELIRKRLRALTEAVTA